MRKLIKRFRKFFQNLRYDLRYGKFLGGVKNSPYSHLGVYDTANTDYSVLKYLFVEKPQENAKLVDVGCGKGRVLNWLIEMFPMNDIIGIEIDESVAKQTQHRLRKWKNVQVYHQDITDDLPNGLLIFYLFNPFDGFLLEKFIKLLLLKIDEGKISKDSYIIYYNPMHLDVFHTFSDRFTFTNIVVPSFAHDAIRIRVKCDD